jgi:hypothetical protein
MQKFSSEAVFKRTAEYKYFKFWFNKCSKVQRYVNKFNKGSSSGLTNAAEGANKLRSEIKNKLVNQNPTYQIISHRNSSSAKQNQASGPKSNIPIHHRNPTYQISQSPTERLNSRL